MKYAIVSDIHANLQAWKAVLLDIRSMDADEIICLGDSVGYGPNPAEVLESLHESVDHFVLGNHEAALCGKIDEDSFNDEARAIISWTRQRVSEPARRFISEHPLMLAGPRFRCAHAEFSDAGRFCYAFEPADAIPSWQAVNEQLLFAGHTHRPCIMILGRSGTPRMVDPEDFVLEDQKRFLVNVGSVGQPRDGDTRASYCLFDSGSGAVYWRKIPFDIDAYREALQKAGISESASPFLERDPRLGRPPLRDQVPFKPPAEPARDAVNVQYVGQLERKLRAWKILSIASAVAILAAAALAWSAWTREKNRELVITGSEMSVVRAGDFAPESNLLSFPSAPVEAGAPIPHWSLQLGDRYRQRAKWASVGSGKNGFVIHSSNREAELTLNSAAIHAAPGMKLCMQAYVKGSGDFAGNIAAVLVLVQQQVGRDHPGAPSITFETNLNFVVKEPNQLRQDGWMLAQQTITLPARSRSVMLQLRGRFQGVVFVRDLRLELKP